MENRKVEMSVADFIKNEKSENSTFKLDTGLFEQVFLKIQFFQKVNGYKLPGDNNVYDKAKRLLRE